MTIAKTQNISLTLLNTVIALGHYFLTSSVFLLHQHL